MNPKQSLLLAAVAILPALALAVTWLPMVEVVMVSRGTAPHSDSIEQLRTVPGNQLLEEMHSFAVSYPSFDDLTADEVVTVADQLIAGTYVPEETGRPLRLPFEVGPYLFQKSSWHRHLHSFSVPSLLGRAYRVSGNTEYLQAAVQYIIDWADFESSLFITRGYVFNDHAVAARSIVLTDIWRQYRSSGIYEEDMARKLLHYVTKLFRQLSDDDQYEFRTNHGFMQSLSLLHLAVAFPLLDGAERSLSLGAERLTNQLDYYVNNEGVVLEHSAAYHVNGTKRLDAAYQYLALADVPISDGMIRRIEWAFEFSNALLRPDGTLPTIGDTSDGVYDRITSRFLQEEGVRKSRAYTPDAVPKPATLAPGAGWIVLWDGLDNWPAASRMSQTVFHWANFPTRAHKHADELSLSIWARGTQLVRGVGNWPYIRSRGSATGWRSSNAPHWLGESPSVTRQSNLRASTVDENFSFFDVVRNDSSGSQIHRQLSKLDGRTWVVLDSFASASGRTGEVIWRFPPNLAIDRIDETRYLLGANDPRKATSMTLAGSGAVKIEFDSTGTAAWNTGLRSDGDIVASPALRMITDGQDPALLTVFSIGGDEVSGAGQGEPELDWEGEDSWRITLSGNRNDTMFERDSNRLRVRQGSSFIQEYVATSAIAEAGIAPAQSALDALARASAQYEIPYQAHLVKRSKVSVAIALAAIVQWVVLVVIRRRWGRLLVPAIACASLAWIGLSYFLRHSYLL